MADTYTQLQSDRPAHVHLGWGAPQYKSHVDAGKESLGRPGELQKGRKGLWVLASGALTCGQVVSVDPAHKWAGTAGDAKYEKAYPRRIGPTGAAWDTIVPTDDLVLWWLMVVSVDALQGMGGFVHAVDSMGKQYIYLDRDIPYTAADVDTISIECFPVGIEVVKACAADGTIAGVVHAVDGIGDGEAGWIIAPRAGTKVTVIASAAVVAGDYLKATAAGTVAPDAADAPNVKLRAITAAAGADDYVLAEWL